MRTLDLAADANARLAEDPSLVRDWLEGPVNDYLARITSFKLDDPDTDEPHEMVQKATALLGIVPTINALMNIWAAKDPDVAQMLGRWLAEILSTVGTNLIRLSRSDRLSDPLNRESSS